MDFHVISGKSVHQVIHEDLAGCIDTVRAAYLAHHAGATVNPSSHFLRFPDRPDCRIIALPASIHDRFDVSGIKWIASYPQNIKCGLPRASAVLVLNRRDNGYPFACLESSVISAARTAASAVLAAEALHGSRHVRCLGLIGTGFINRYVYQFFVQSGWQVDHVVLFDSDRAEAARFRRDVCDDSCHAQIEIASDVSGALRKADLVVFATTAPRPYFDDAAALSRSSVVLHLSLRDLGARVILAAQNIVDDINHVLTANTSLHLVEQTECSREFIAGTLGDILTGRMLRASSRPVVFSPFGLGILDVALGKWVFDRAMARGAGIRISDFFFDLTR